MSARMLRTGRAEERRDGRITSGDTIREIHDLPSRRQGLRVSL